LKEHGYDGLVDLDIECGCEITDLMPCDAPGIRCEAGHKVKGNSDYDWLILPGKYNDKEA